VRGVAGQVCGQVSAVVAAVCGGVYNGQQVQAGSRIAERSMVRAGVTRKVAE